MNLFRLHSTFSSYRGRSNVRFDWFVEERKPIVHFPYSKLITDYEDIPQKENGRRYVSELFLQSEAADFITWYLLSYGIETVAEKVETPLSSNLASLSKKDVGDGYGHMPCWLLDGYDLAFNVTGYFDLRDCELDDIGLKWRDKYLLEITLDDLGFSLQDEIRVSDVVCEFRKRRMPEIDSHLRDEYLLEYALNKLGLPPQRLERLRHAVSEFRKLPFPY